MPPRSRSHRPRRPRVHRGTTLARRSSVVQRHARPPRDLAPRSTASPTRSCAIDDDEPSGLGWLPDGRLLVVAMETQRLLRLRTRRRSRRARRPLVHGARFAQRHDRRRRRHGLPRRHGRAHPRARQWSVGPGRPSASRPTACGSAPPTTWSHQTGTSSPTTGARSSWPRAGEAFTAFTVQRGRHAHRPAHLRPRLAFAHDDVALRAARRHLPRRRGRSVGRRPPLHACVPRASRAARSPTPSTSTPTIPVACVLGGHDRRTLLMCVAADWKRDALVGTRFGRIVAADVDIPGAGRP